MMAHRALGARTVHDGRGWLRAARRKMLAADAARPLTNTVRWYCMFFLKGSRRPIFADLRLLCTPLGRARFMRAERGPRRELRW